MANPVQQLSQWPQFSPESPHYLHITAESSRMDILPTFYADRMSYWMSKTPVEEETADPEVNTPIDAEITYEEETETIEVVEDIKDEL